MARPTTPLTQAFAWDNSGNLWMAFGSYWNGIYLLQLNPTNGLRDFTQFPDVPTRL